MAGRGTERNVYGQELTAEDVAAGRHRELVGGLWDELGALQLEFLRGQGLNPQDRLVDVGCGCLRAGLHLVRYLEPGRYYGIDVNASLLRAGYEVELAQAGLATRLPRENLLHDGEYAALRFGVAFDVALAHSLFTHLPAGEVRRCLEALAPALRPGGRLFATFFEAPEGPPLARLEHAPGGIVSHADGDPFHYRRSELVELATGLPLRPRYLGEWGHPRDQRMLCFERT